MPAALAGGAIDCTLTTYDRVATAAGPSCGGAAVVAARTISTISDLTGRTLACTLKTDGMSDKVIQPCT